MLTLTKALQQSTAETKTAAFLQGRGYGTDLGSTPTFSQLEPAVKRFHTLAPRNILLQIMRDTTYLLRTILFRQ